MIRTSNFYYINGPSYSLRFQIIPRVMPALVPEQNLREKFNDDDYVREVENMFREKFLQNLDVSRTLLAQSITCFISKIVTESVK